MSPNYFCHYFKQEIGKTPISFINEYRIEKACEMLSESEAPISDIALSVGFLNHTQPDSIQNPPIFLHRIVHKAQISAIFHCINCTHSTFQNAFLWPTSPAYSDHVGQTINGCHYRCWKGRDQICFCDYDPDIPVPHTCPAPMSSMWNVWTALTEGAVPVYS